MGKQQLGVYDSHNLKTGGGQQAARGEVRDRTRTEEISPSPEGRPTAGHKVSKQVQAQATAGGTRAELIAETRAGTERTSNSGIGPIPKGRTRAREETTPPD